MAEIRKDCILYSESKNDCIGLKKLYCQEEDCNFYKKQQGDAGKGDSYEN